VLTLVALILSSVLGGQRYLYCRAMGEIMTPTCDCARAHAPEQGQPWTSIESDCFEVRTLDRLAPSAWDRSSSFRPRGSLRFCRPPFAVRRQPMRSRRLQDVRFEQDPFSPIAAQAKLTVFLT
jgi:hypothetical protein